MVLVIDASVVIELVIRKPPYANLVRHRIEQRPITLAAPHLLDPEVVQGIRSNLLRGRLTQAEAHTALDNYEALSIERYAHISLLRRAFALRDNATVYDALYLVLAEALDAPLLTRDEALAAVPGTGARVEVIGGG